MVVSNPTATRRRTVGQIPKNVKKPQICCDRSLIQFMFVCWNLFCTIANLRIKCLTETKNVSVLFYKNYKSSFLHDTHLIPRFLYILGCSGPWCGTWEKDKIFVRHLKQISALLISLKLYYFSELTSSNFRIVCMYI